MKNKCLSIVFALLLVISSSFLITACSKDSSFNLVGKWNGSTLIQKNIDVTCEEYETLSGEYLGKRCIYFNSIFLVDNIVKDLFPAHDGLIERSTRKYLGETYTYTYVLKDKTTDEILYSSEDISYYEYNACYNKETKEFIGIASSSYEKTYGVYTYLIDGTEYSSYDVSCVSDAYVINETNIYIGQKYNFNEERTYIIDNKIYASNEVYELEWKSSSGINEKWFSGNDGGCFVEKESMYCYKTGEVERSSGYQYQTNNSIYPNNQVKLIKRSCFGQEVTDIEVQFGDNYAEIKILVSTTYNYENIKNFTFDSLNSQSIHYFRGYFGKLNNTIFLDVEQYSYNGIDWYSYEQKVRKFEFSILNNSLLFKDKSVYDNGLIYQDTILNK